MIELIDCHSHILPGIDDGSACVEESLALLRKTAEQGIRHVIATPHFYAQYETPEAFLEKRSQSESVLRRAMQEAEGLPRLSVGAEVYFFRGMSDSEILPRLTIDGKHCILIEMPPAPWTPSMYRELEDIWHKRGLTPIVAHIDRYIRPFRTYQIPEHLARMPVLVQANASFFLNGRTRRLALRLLRSDKIHLLGSDCHNLANRPPRLGEAAHVIEKHLGQHAILQLKSWQNDLLLDG